MSAEREQIIELIFTGPALTENEKVTDTIRLLESQEEVVLVRPVIPELELVRSPDGPSIGLTAGSSEPDDPKKTFAQEHLIFARRRSRQNARRIMNRRTPPRFR